MSKVDWTAVEKLLLDAATAQLATFASAHAGETVYGAIFDVEPFDGCRVNLLLNTEAHLIAEWKEAPAADDLHRRFMPGCFEHRLPLTKSNKAFPVAAIEALTEADMEDDATDDDGLWQTTRTLLDTCCKVALALEDSAFAKLSRTADFTISVTPDPREPGDLAVARYAKFRRAALRKSKPLPNKPPVGR